MFCHISDKKLKQDDIVYEMQFIEIAGTKLFFGLPVLGSIKNNTFTAKDVMQAYFLSQCLSDQSYYKYHSTQTESDDTIHYWIAQDKKSINYQSLIFHYYGRFGMDIYDEEVPELIESAYERLELELNNFFKTLYETPLPQKEKEFKKKIKNIALSVFGAEHAWSILYFLENNGLYVTKSNIYIKEQEYKNIIKKIGAQKGPNKINLHSVIDRDFKEWKQKYLVEYEKMIDIKDSLMRHMLIQSHMGLYNQLLPKKTVTNKNSPLYSHFWETSEIKKILDIWTDEEIINSILFLKYFE